MRRLGTADLSLEYGGNTVGTDTLYLSTIIKIQVVRRITSNPRI